jgi:hypothetical protein
MHPVNNFRKRRIIEKERKDRKKYSKIAYGKTSSIRRWHNPSSGGKITGFRRSRKCRQEGEIVKGIVVQMCMRTYLKNKKNIN